MGSPMGHGSRLLMILLISTVSAAASSEASAASSTNSSPKPNLRKQQKPLKKPDLLFPSSGLLLVQKPGFIQTGLNHILIHFSDGISPYRQHPHADCGDLENNVSLAQMRAYFTRYVGQILTENGFNYTIDQQAAVHLNTTSPFNSSTSVVRGRRKALTSQPETTAIPVTTIEINEYEDMTAFPPTVTSRLIPTTEPKREMTSNVIVPLTFSKLRRHTEPIDPFISGSMDHLIQPNSTDYTLDCKLITLQNRMCEHKGHHPRTVYDITLPSSNHTIIFQMTFKNYTIFDGQADVQVRGDAMALSYHVNDTNVLTLMIASSGNFVLHKLESNFVDKDDHNTFVYVCLSGYIPNTKFTYSVEDVMCGDCLFYASTKITLLDNHPLVHQRNRRSWFFNLQTKTEVDNELRKALKISKDWRSLSRQELDNTARLIKKNNLAIIHNTDSLAKLYSSFCTAQAVNLDELATIQYRSQIMQATSRLLAVINQCSHGNLPDQLDFESIHTICIVHLSHDICQRLGHRIRDVMACQNQKIRLTNEKFLVTFDITVPKALNLTSYSIFKPLSIPVFQGLYVHQISKLEPNLVMKYTNQNSIVLLNDCREVGSTWICQPSQSADDKTASCVTGILQNSTMPCFTESYEARETCYTKTYSNGILVSTKNPLEVHVSDSENLFRSRAKTVQGVTIIPNSSNLTYSISCNGLLATTKMVEHSPVNIFDHEWVLEDSLTPITNRDLHRQIVEDKRKSEETLDLIMGNISTIDSDHNQNWLDTFPSLDSPHGTSSAAMYFCIALLIFILGILSIVLVKKFCCGRQVQIISATNPHAFMQQSQPFITTST